MLLQNTTHTLIYNNKIYDGVVIDEGNTTGNTYNIPQLVKGRNIVGGAFIGGNFWINYKGRTGNISGIGTTPYKRRGMSVSDKFPLVI